MDKVVKNFVGIDISKRTIDVAVIADYNRKNIKYRRFDKTKASFEKMIHWLKKMEVNIDTHTVFCMEHTGLYNRSLLNFLIEKNALIWVEMAIHIKRSLGMQRGKNDKVDAFRIVTFAYKNREDIKSWQPVDEHIYKLKDLLAQRERIVQTKQKLVVPLKELHQEGLKEEAEELDSLQQPLIQAAEESIAKIEKIIQEIISEEEHLQKLFIRITSITGIGKVTAWHIIAFTNGFKRLMTGKQLACYCGVVPFEHTSGTSIKGKPRVSHMADKKLKTILTLCARAAITSDGELKKYYERKLEEGKNKSSVINAIRNKLVLRVVAVVRDDRDYQKKYNRDKAQKAA